METGMANINRTKLYYEISGQGPPLVFLHAGLMDSRMWDEQFQGFAEYFKVIRHDVRGAGKSEMPTAPFSHYEDLYELLRFLNIDKAFLVGLSLGGRIAVDFGIAHPEMVKALVLVGAGLSGYVFSQSYIEKIIAVISAVKDGSISRPGATSLSDSFLALSPGHETARKKIIQMLTDNAQAFSIGPSLMQELNPPAIGRLAEIRTPTLIIVGDHDGPDVQAMADLLTADIAGAKKVVMTGAGHMINLERPEAFNKVVLDFLNRLQPCLGQAGEVSEHPQAGRANRVGDGH